MTHVKRMLNNIQSQREVGWTKEWDILQSDYVSGVYT